MYGLIKCSITLWLTHLPIRKVNFEYHRHITRRSIEQSSSVIPFLLSFQGGEVHDGSELIGPVEPASDSLTDNLSDCSSEGLLSSVM